MMSLGNMTIRRKLIAIQLLTAFIVLLFYGVVSIVSETRLYQFAVTRKVSSLAELLGLNCVSALHFQDNAAAGNILASVQADEDVVNAWIYDADGNLFASYSRKGFEGFAFPRRETGMHEFEPGYLTLSEAITEDQDVLGSIMLRLDVRHFQRVLRRSMTTAGIVLAVAMIIALLLSSATQRTISAPIQSLAHTVGEMSFENLSKRAKIVRNDEIGTLAASFNQMAENLEKSHNELRKAHDGLEEKVAERTEELAQANVRLKELDRLKSMFIASMSHELRTPLNAIIGFTGIILQGMAGEVTEEQKRQLTMVSNSGNHLLALINDVIDVSKIEAEKIDLIISEFDLADVMHEVQGLFTVAMDEKGLKMPLEMPERLAVESDGRRVKQIIMNLVSNAMKFTDKGEIRIEAAAKDGMAEISVADTGRGIKEEDIGKLFRQFSRIQITGIPTVEGTGLGLYLSQKIADLLGGRIRAESEFGKGSVFTFTLPLKYKEVTG